MSFRSARNSAGLGSRNAAPAVMTARFSIGIDLGTTNSALAYVPLTGDAQPEVLAISQWESPARAGRGADAALVPLSAGGRACRAAARQGSGNRGMDCRPPRPPQGRRNARPGRPVGKVLAVSPRGRPVRADPALGIGGSCAGAKDLARPGRRVHPELSAGRLGQPLRPIRLRVR